MLKRSLCVFLGLFFIELLKAEELPNYIKKCKLSDPNMNECFVKNANDAIPTLVKGDPTFKLINMSPVVIPVVNLGSGPNLEMKLTQVTSNNIKDFRLSKANFDLKSNKIWLNSKMDRLEVISNYFIKGQILVLPINGEGKSNITFIGNDMTYEADIGSKDINGIKYYTIENPTLKAIPDKVYFHFDNLFGGDPNLGKQMNNFLDENWSDFYDELKPALQKAMEAVVTNVFKVYFAKVPADKLFE
ncbi:protein takeout-like [Onthophagus taurus]|uniref:protein takeout-like n=1 Tax=Onthophagus taurus TaxID=166361 RepID=UPI0039BDDB9F